MTDDTDFDDAEDVDPIDPDDYPGLKQVVRFSEMVRNTPWFVALGDELDDDEVEWSTAYLENLGFSYAEVVPVRDWEEAEAAAQNPDWNSDWWEAEEQQRAYLLSEALTMAPEDDVMLALSHAAGAASDSAQNAAAMAAAHHGITDEGLILAAAGAATQACYQAALVLAADSGDEHPFALKFRLFESGRWPLGVVGNSFNLF